jgi:hypothetical protein
MFWQGGFVFYAGVVVPVGTEVLGSASEQALITRHVTRYLNLSGTVSVILFAWDLAATRSGRGAYWGRWLCWLALAAGLAVLYWLHPHLNGMFRAEELTILDRPSFRFWHRTYLWVSTVQWAFAVGFAVFSLAAWRAEDRLVSPPLGCTNRTEGTGP